MRSSGISTTVVAVIVVVIVVIGGAGAYFALSSGSGGGGTSSQTSTTSTTSTGTFTPVQGNVSAVVSQVNLLVQAFNNANVEAVTGFYNSNSVDVWSGQTEGLGGTYSGTGNIRILYSASIGHANTISAKASHLQMVTEAPGVVNASMNVVLVGTSTALGNFNASISATQQWVNNGGTWTIQKENWNYLSFYSSNPTTATVFPQWGLQISGKSVNLASEHVFEWNVAPYMALAVYVAVIATVAYVLLAKSRKRSQ